MLLCYLDESIHNGFYLWGGVIGDEVAMHSLALQFDELGRVAHQKVGTPEDTEFHAYPMFHGKEEWANVYLRQRIEYAFKIAAIISRCEVRAFHYAIRADSLDTYYAGLNTQCPYTPDQLILRSVMKMIQQLAKEAETYALVTMDERSDREQQRDEFKLFQQSGTQERHLLYPCDRILDTMHFAPSHRSRMLQAADNVAFYARRHLSATESSAKARKTMDALWSKLSSNSTMLGSSGMIQLDDR